MRIFSLIYLLFSLNCFSQVNNIDSSYLKTYDILANMLSGKAPLSFKYAVFLCENTYLRNKLDYIKFNEHITKLADLVKYSVELNSVTLKGYSYPDSLDIQKNYALFNFFRDTLKVLSTVDGDVMHLPYTYDFKSSSSEDWSNMFVTKLLATHSGNCHSLPYLYKILADELGSSCWLSLAPNHMYIKNRCKKNGWYNTELTSGEFPVDAWLTASGYISVKAIQSGIYMDTLSNRQAIALCILDLAKGYEKQTKNYYDGFIIKCCDLVLQYHPVNVLAILLKAETLKRVYEQQKDNSIYAEVEKLYTQLFDLGYREMPEKMYQDWLKTMIKEKRKYSNGKKENF